MAELGNGDDLDESPDQRVESLLQHLQKPLTARLRYRPQSSRVAIDQDCFIKAIKVDKNWSFVHRRIKDIEKDLFPRKSICLIGNGDSRPNPRIGFMWMNALVLKVNTDGHLLYGDCAFSGARKSSPTIDEVKSWFNQSYHNTICDGQFCSRPSHLLDENPATTEARRRCRVNARNRLGYCCQGGTDRLPHSPPCLPTGPTIEESTHSKLVGTSAHIAGVT
ncbi:hypothetical protein BGAL_0094g00110 [Botrytis galanthina]|uniref:Uncharacterized protein n=1 Tax=Botrytis galanthina TaxID=278940 RepID=A0A4S8R4C2_9HELO|nr:hypothetical protein BGAL_0094g00110 [Botrytis galanthina]